jgi:hypothetical protein
MKISRKFWFGFSHNASSVMGSSIYIFDRSCIGIIFTEKIFYQGTGKFEIRSFKFSSFLHYTDVKYQRLIIMQIRYGM